MINKAFDMLFDKNSMNNEVEYIWQNVAEIDKGIDLCENVYQNILKKLKNEVISKSYIL